MSTARTLGTRSFTDPLSNATFIGKIDLKRDLEGIVKGRFPQSAVVPFIHEFTHHWCLYSPLGQALTLLELRAVRKVWSATRTLDRELSKEELEDLAWAVLDDYSRYDVTVAVLRPLFEGIAVFAETEGLPGDTEVVLNATYWLARGFSHQHLEGADDIWQAVRGLLLDVRLSREFMERKESLLAEPLSAVKSGYLASYLFVKDMWTGAANSDGRFLDKDLFISAFKSYFFDDLGLVAHLLDPESRDIGAAGVIGDYFKTRVNALVEHGFDGIADAILTAGQGKLGVRPLTGEEDITLESMLEELPRLRTPGDLWDLGARRLQAAFDDLLDGTNESSLTQRLSWLVAQREMMAIGHTNADIIVSEVMQVGCIIDDEPLLVGPMIEAAREQILPGKYAGILSAFLFPYQGFHSFAVTVDGTPVLTWCSKQASPVMREQFERYMLDMPALVDASNAMRTFVEEFIESDSGTSGILTIMRNVIDGWYKVQFAEQAFRNVPPERRDSIRSDFDRAGYGGALGSRSALRALTWLSVIASFFPNLEDAGRLFELDRSFHRQTGSLTETIDYIRKLGRERLNDELIFPSSNGAIWSAV
jgi:hypothetical protein